MLNAKTKVALGTISKGCVDDHSMNISHFNSSTLSYWGAVMDVIKIEAENVCTSNRWT